jgi:molybdopterin converting factor small subunit
MEVRVRVPAPLRDLVAGAHTVTVDPGGVAIARAGAGVTVGAVLDVLAVDHPALERRVRDEQGHTRVHVNLFVGADNIRDLDGLATAITPGQEMSIIPAISGG